MAKIKVRFIDIVYWITILIADAFIFMLIGLFLMGYEDNYDSSKGEYFSFESMNKIEALIWICYNIWILINIIGIGYVFRKIYKHFRK